MQITKIKKKKKKKEKKFYSFQIIAYDFVALNFSIKQIMLVIGSQCVNKQS